MNRTYFVALPAVLILAFTSVKPALSESYCYDCHGTTSTSDNRPVDAPYRNVTTGGFQGNHRTHMSAGAGSNSCANCHPDSDLYISGHRDGKIKVSSHVKNSPLITTYNNMTSSFDQTTTPALERCRNVNCHFEMTTPIWGGANFESPVDCDKCHGAPPAGAASEYVGGAAGSHAKHALRYPGTDNCAKCHSNHAAETNKFAHATSAGNRGLVVSFATAPNNGSGSYSGDVSYPRFLPSQGPTPTGTCNNTYCHSMGTSTTPSSPNIAAIWSGSLNASCSGCHGNDNAAEFKMGTVGSTSHARHVQAYSHTCDNCHTATAGDSRTISNWSNHVNGAVDIQFSPWVNSAATYAGSTPKSKLPGSATGACANTYCHSNGTSVSSGTIPANATVDWGTAGPLACNGCHGNATYGSDFRKATPLYASGSPKGNAHEHHIRAGSLSGIYMQCFNCHAATTRTNNTIADASKHVDKTYNVAGSVYGAFSSSFWDGDNTMYINKVTLTHNYNASGSSCSNVSCHPVGLDIATSPPTPKTRSTSSIKWNGSGICIDCHNIDMQSTSTFHHAMRNYSSGYPLQSPYSSSDNGINAYARRCTMCHVDHDIFSDDLNSSNTLGRAANLRTDIAVTPTLSSGYSNRDFIKSSGGSGGICISCHSTAKVKDTIRRRNDSPARVTPIVTQVQYSSSAHQYDVPAMFMSDNSTVYGNCSKCHNALLNETSVFMNATSTYQFGNHNSGIRRLQGSLGAAGGETAEEQICYRCHSLNSDADPGGGPPKVVANRDFYGVASMSLASQDIFAANLDFRPANPTYSTTNKLYFKPTVAESPAEAMPNGHNTGDTFAGGSWIGRSMSPWETTSAYETKSQMTNTSGTSYWQMVTFTSPKVNSTTTVPAGSWVINVYCRESSTSQNARIRYMVYKWNDPADSMGATLIAKGTNATELATTAAPGAVRQISVNVGATTLTAGEKIVVDLSLETTATYTTGYTASFFFGSHAPGDLTLPGNVSWAYADSGVAGFGHRTQYYSGIHLPSTQNETLAYIAQNRHVDCVDCHNPHATANGLHGDYGIATGGSTTTLLNSIKNWVPNQWAGAFINIISGTGAGQTRSISSNTATTITVPTWTAPVAGSVYRIITNTNVVSRSQRGVQGASVSYSAAWTRGTFSMVNEAAYEYQICFKCHAVTDATYNSVKYWNVTSPSLGAARWTDIGLEFNPNNISYHPVVQPLPATGNRRLTTAALTGGWAPGLVMSCSDCHGRDTGTSATAQGPHGSTVKWMLTGTYQNWPFTSTAANGTAAGGTLLTGTGSSTIPANNFCFNCHTWAAGGLAHTKSATGHNLACVDCHIRVPHGGKVPRLLTGVNAPSRYKPNGNGGGFGARYLTSAILPATGYMLATHVSCNSVCGAKHTDNSLKANYW